MMSKSNKRVAKKKEATKKEICNMVAYLTIISQNKGIGNILTDEQFFDVMKKFTEVFGMDDRKAIEYYENMVLKLKEKVFA